MDTAMKKSFFLLFSILVGPLFAGSYIWESPNGTISQNPCLGCILVANGTTWQSVAGTDLGGNLTTIFGYQAGYSNLTISKSVIIGPNAGQYSVGGLGDIYIGWEAGLENTAIGDTFVGYVAGAGCTTGGETTAVGNHAGEHFNAGSENCFVGPAAGAGANSFNINDGSNNTFIGALAGTNNYSGGSNAAVGYAALGDNTTGTGNTAIGSNSGAADPSGSDNVWIGNGAGQNAVS